MSPGRPVGRHPSSSRVCSLEAGQTTAVNGASQPRWAAASSGDSATTGTLNPKVDLSPYYTYTNSIVRIGSPAMVQTSALEFQRKFGEFQHQAQREPVEITRHGRREFVLMSAEHYDWLTAAAKRTYRTVDATQVVIDAVERAEMDPEHAALDELLK
jgi:prevent-host-death family protein